MKEISWAKHKQRKNVEAAHKQIEVLDRTVPQLRCIEILISREKKDIGQQNLLKTRTEGEAQKISELESRLIHTKNMGAKQLFQQLIS